MDGATDAETMTWMVHLIEKLLSAEDTELKHYCASAALSELQHLFEQIWKQVRQANTYGGQPRNASCSVEVARLALRLAKNMPNERLQAEAWRAEADALNGNEEYV